MSLHAIAAGNGASRTEMVPNGPNNGPEPWKGFGVFTNCVVEPMGIFIDTYGTCPFNLTDGEIAKKVSEIFDMRPAAIEERLKLRQPMYSETAAYGHMGRHNEVVTKTFQQPNGEPKTLEVELFTWEKLDYVNKVKAAFGL